MRREESWMEEALADVNDVEKEEALLKRLDQSLLKHVAAVTTGDGHPTIEELYKLAPLISTHEYLSEHAFVKEDLDALLRFQDPLEVVATCAEVGNPIVEIFLEDCLEEGRAEERFPLVDKAPTQAKPQAKTSQTRKNRSAGRHQGR